MILLQATVSGLLLGAVYALFSCGLTLIWGMMNFINFAHGEFVMLGMYAALLATWAGLGPAFFAPGAAIALFALGAIVYLGVIKQVMRGPMLAQILSSFGLALLLRYTAFFVFKSDFRTLPESELSGTLHLFGLYIARAQLLAGAAAALLAFAMHMLLTRSALGSRMLAVAEDRQAAMLMGIRPDRMQTLAWGLSAASAGVAGALMAIAYPFSPAVGETFALTAFVVVTLGGFGSVPGAMIAGFVIGLVEALAAYLIGPVYKDVVVYAIFVAVLWVRPQGLLGASAR